MVDFVVHRWAACAPGLLTADAWRAWAAAPSLPQSSDALPTLSTMPSMLRRRLNTLGKVSLQSVYDVHPEPTPVPMVTASRHGDLQRSVDLLRCLAAQEALSPTDFSLSVANAIAGIYSIARFADQDVAPPYTTVVAGPCSAEAALMEAACQLHEGASAVLVVVYDAPMPEVYAEFIDEPQCLFAWSWLVRAKNRDDAVYHSLTLGAPQAPTVAGALPHGLDVLRFFLHGQPHMTFAVPGQAWHWQRHA